MAAGIVIDEDLVRRLPLPLAQLYRRAHNAKTPYECHQAAYYLWEASLKLLACVAIIEYAQLGQRDPDLDDQLQKLSRPALGDWWRFVRQLIPALVNVPVEGFEPAKEYLLGRQRADLPRAAGLDVALREALEGQSTPRATVKLAELFDRLVRYRNAETGHGAAGLRSADHYSRMSRALLLGVSEILERVDVLAGRRLVYVSEMRKLTSGNWLVERFELSGELPHRLEPLEFADDDSLRLVSPQLVYVEREQKKNGQPAQSPQLQSLHPLLFYDLDSNEFLFLNTTCGKHRSEYVCYTTGRVFEKEDLATERRALLSHLLARDVNSTAFEEWAAVTRSEEPWSPRESAPRRALGEYELLSRIGQGAMGIVYRAWQPSLGRQVALKSLLRMGDPKAEARFRREIHALGRVEHPHLVKIFTSGSDGDQWFFTMELIDGANLGSVCTKLGETSSANVSRQDWERAVSTAVHEAHQSEQPLNGDLEPPVRPTVPPTVELLGQVGVLATAGHIQQVVGILRQVSLAAHALHDAGVVHRDIKPGNIMVIPGSEHAVLMDLGLAQLADESEGRLTRTRQFVGTLRYASPEQILSVAKLDRRSDVYSLGATLYELLTLQPLFGAADQTAIPDLMLKIQSAEPDRPSRVNPRIPKDLDAITLKCLEKNPSHRYSSARELADDLDHFLNHEPIRARTVRSLERTWRWCRRNPVVSSLMAAVALSLVAGAIISSVFAIKASEQAWRAEHQLYAAEIAAANCAWQANDIEDAWRHLDACKPEFRGWETEYLSALFRKDQQRLFGNQGPVVCVAFSPDGKGIVSVGADQTIRIWDAGSGQPAPNLHGDSGLASDVAFSPDSKQIVGGAPDGTLKIWDLASGRQIHVLRGHTDRVNRATFSPDGKQIASASSDRTLRVWDAAVGRPICTLQGHAGAVNSVDFCRDGKQLASGSADGTVKIWDIASGREIKTLRGHKDAVNSVAYSPDGSRIASGGADWTVKIWNARKNEEPLTLRGHKEAVASVAFGPNGKRIVSGSADQTIKVWDPVTGQEIRTLRARAGKVSSVAFSPDANRVASGCFDGTVRIWNAAGQTERPVLAGHTGAVLCVAPSPDGRRIVSGGREQTIRVWDLATAREQIALKGHKAAVTSVAFNPDGRHIVSAGADHAVKIWDLATGAESLSIDWHGAAVSAVAFSPDGEKVGSGSLDETVRIWSAVSGQELLEMSSRGGPLNCIAFSPDGARIAGGTSQNGLRVWDIGSGKELETLAGHAGAVLSVAFSPDGRQIASGGADHAVKIWRTSDGAELYTLQGHTDEVNAVRYSPDGTRLMSGSSDRTLRVWDPKTGQETITLRGHVDRVTCIAVTADGKRLFSGSDDESIIIWDATPPVSAWRWQ